MVAWVERAALTSGLLALFLGGYFGVGLLAPSAPTIAVRTALDESIPFFASAIWIYIGMFALALLPLFVVRSSTLFRRTALAYATVIVVSTVFFVAMPVAANLRAGPEALAAEGVSTWVVRIVYALDPPRNLFPSLHLSIAVLAAMASSKALGRSNALGILHGPLTVVVASVALSVCLVKQHYIVDAVAGLALGGIVGWCLIIPYQPRREETPSGSLRGLALFLLALAACYAMIVGFYFLFG